MMSKVFRIPTELVPAWEIMFEHLRSDIGHEREVPASEVKTRDVLVRVIELVVDRLGVGPLAEERRETWQTLDDHLLRIGRLELKVKRLEAHLEKQAQEWVGILPGRVNHSD